MKINKRILTHTRLLAQSLRAGTLVARAPQNSSLMFAINYCYYFYFRSARGAPLDSGM